MLIRVCGLSVWDGEKLKGPIDTYVRVSGNKRALICDSGGPQPEMCLGSEEVLVKFSNPCV